MKTPSVVRNEEEKNKRVGNTANAAKLALLALLMTAAATLTGCTAMTTGSPKPAGAGSGNNTGGTVEGILASTPSGLNFGSQSIGSPAIQTATITNTGIAPVTVSQIAVSGKGFGLQAPGSSTFTIPAGQTVSVQVQFVPQSAAASSGTLSIVSNASNSPLVLTLSGTGQAAPSASLSATPAIATFSNVPVGTGNSQTITLSNTGNASLTILRESVSGTGFGIQGLSLPLTVAAGNSVSFNATFTPVASGNVSGVISLTSDAGNSPLSIALAGNGAAATRLLGASTQNVTFGNIAIGNSQSAAITLTNSGNSDVTISGVKVTGTGFAVTGATPGTTVAPGQATVLNVTFDPRSAGRASGAVAVMSNASNSPTISVAGTGTQPSPHWVALAWDPSSSDVVGYFVYRGLASGGPYTKLNASPEAPTAFSDLNVQPGQTYVYVVTAVDSNSVESPLSNEVIAAVPLT
jgi:Abnormal spindle-like microcephaly-assoc'd, ASPM-SPD-2-Hydin